MVCETRRATNTPCFKADAPSSVLTRITSSTVRVFIAVVVVEPGRATLYANICSRARSRWITVVIVQSRICTVNALCRPRRTVCANAALSTRRCTVAVFIGTTGGAGDARADIGTIPADPVLPCCARDAWRAREQVVVVLTRNALLTHRGSYRCIGADVAADTVGGAVRVKISTPSIALDAYTDGCLTPFHPVLPRQAGCTGRGGVFITVDLAGDTLIAHRLATACICATWTLSARCGRVFVLIRTAR